MNTARRERHRQVGLTDPRQRLGDGRVRREDHRLGRHQPAGRVGQIVEQPPDRLGLLGVHRVQQLGLAAGVNSPSRSAASSASISSSTRASRSRVESLDEPHLVLLGELLEQVGEAVVLELAGEHAAAAEWQLAERVGHLGRMQVAQFGRLAVDRPLGGEQLAGL